MLLSRSKLQLHVIHLHRPNASWLNFCSSIGLQLCERSWWFPGPILLKTVLKGQAQLCRLPRETRCYRSLYRYWTTSFRSQKCPTSKSPASELVQEPKANCGLITLGSERRHCADHVVVLYRHRTRRCWWLPFHRDDDYEGQDGQVYRLEGQTHSWSWADLCKETVENCTWHLHEVLQRHR